MSNRSGFPYAQWDSAFLSDAKVRRLARLLPDSLDFYASVGVFSLMVANIWRTASRDDSIEDECEDAPSRIVEALRGARLLDDEWRIPASSFEKWVGPALEKRRQDADRKRRPPPEADGVHGSPVPSSEPTYSTNSPLSSSSTGEGVVGGEDRDSLDRYHELTGYRPWSVFSGEQLRTAERDYGQTQVIAALEAEKGDRTTLLRRALARLARDAEHRRLEAKAKPRPPRIVEDRKAINAEIMRLMAEDKAAQA